MTERPVFYDWHHAFNKQYERKEKQWGTTVRQRDWIKRAWNSVFNAPEGRQVCGFPVIKDGRFYLHGFVEQVQIHHIMPRGYASSRLGWSERTINTPQNLIPLCKNHHIGYKVQELNHLDNVVTTIHPDMEIARRGYTGKKHPTSYDLVFTNREKIMQRGDIYHNPDWDEALLIKAEEVYYRYLNWQLGQYGQYTDPFPVRK